MAVEDDRKAPGFHLVAERITGNKLHQGEAHGPRIACLFDPIVVRMEAISESFGYPFLKLDRHGQRPHRSAAG
jgi:hypothetical protein